MTSVINFRFKNALQQDSVTFDGSVIQVGDIKRLIAVRRGLGVEGAQELTLYDSTTSEELNDDAKLIPRSSLVLVKRAPVTRFKPLTATSTVQTTSQAPSSAAAAPVNVSENQQDDFGGGLYSSTPLVASGEEEALGSLLAGQAATWQREVRQAVIRGRGRGRGGRGGPPLDYRCPRCEAIGAHWLQDCPTHGDPAYDRKRVRPPIGIPLARLGQTEEGGLVLPDGTTGTLVPNEDAFAQEVLGLPTVPDVIQDQQLIEGGNPSAAVPEPPSLLALPAPPASKPPPPPGSPPANASSFFDDFMAGATTALPHGPLAFLQQAFDRPTPLLRRDFERIQDDFRRQAGLAPLWRQRPQRPTRRSGSPPRRRSRSPSRREGPSTWRQDRSPPRRTWKPRNNHDDKYGRRRTSPSREDIRERERGKSLEREQEKGSSHESEQQKGSNHERERERSPGRERQRVRSPSQERQRERSKSRERQRGRSSTLERERERSSNRPGRRPSRSPAPSPSTRKLGAREHANGKDGHRSRDDRRGSRPSRVRSERKEADIDRWEQRSPSYSPPPREREERVKPRALEAASRKKSDDDAGRVDSGKRSRSPEREGQGADSKRDRHRIVYKATSPERSPSPRREHRHHKKEKKERKEKHRSRDREKKSSRHRH